MRTLNRAWYCRLNAEQAWRDDSVARILPLPELRSARSQKKYEFLLGFGTDGDAQITSALMPDSFLQLYRDAGNHDPVFMPTCRPASASTFQPYAVTPDTVRVGIEAGFDVCCPPMDVVVLVNSKRWSGRLRHELGRAYGDVHVDSFQGLEHAVRQVLSSARAVVVKEDFGVAGAGSVRIQSERHLQRLSQVLRRQVDAGKSISLTIEPWLDRDWDFSSLGEITLHGEITFLGFAGMINIESRFGVSHSLPESREAWLAHSGYLEVFEEVARSLRTAGYFGYFCLDSMVLRDRSVIPMVEINARASLGLLNHFQRKRAGREMPHAALFSVFVGGHAPELASMLLAAVRNNGLHYNAKEPTRVGAIVLGIDELAFYESGHQGNNAQLRLQVHMLLLYEKPNDLANWLDRFREAATRDRLFLAGVGIKALGELASERWC